MNKIKNPLLIVANGDFPSHPIPLEILRNSTSILSCDGATNSLISNGYMPNLIIGDLDSIIDKHKKNLSDIIIENNDQEENDLRKAINYAIKKNIKEINIIGATGKREDHSLGNIFSLLIYKNENIKIFTDTGFFRCIHKSSKIKSFKGQQVSLFCTNPDTEITTKHLKYNFNKKSITHLHKGTLNESDSTFFEIKINQGSLLIYQKY